MEGNSEEIEETDLKWKEKIDEQRNKFLRDFKILKQMKKNKEAPDH